MSLLRRGTAAAGVSRAYCWNPELLRAGSAPKHAWRSSSLLAQSNSPLLGSSASLRSMPGLARQTQGLRLYAVAAVSSPKTSPVVKEAHGFKLQREQFVKEYDSVVLLYKHEKTGAEVISVLNTDENKTFGVVFRTPVDNSYGIPHILEHSVLCGSRKYPIKEPFVELMKSSLNTFLNAFTYPDRTCYPVASTNTQDFYNLVDVYLDAVFHPRCITDAKVFEQEGWHYELNAAEAGEAEEEISYKGVVFNEMKGVYSSPDSVYYRVVQQALFPGNTYQHDSGGDPTQIPDLKYAEFQDFHAKYYHPSNARFWFYGDDDSTKRLEILDQYLNEFEARAVSSAVATQPLVPQPRRVVQHYAAGEGEEEQKAYVGINWILTDEVLDVETELALGFLDYLMLGTNASPLRKAMNDSGLGAAVIGGGIDDELKQAVFGLGLKGVDPSNIEKVEALIMEKLEEMASSGFSSTAVEAAMNTIEFSLRENNTGSFPRGLSLMLRAVSAWIYDKDPFQPIQWEDALNSFKTKLASGQDLFTPLIRKYILNNQHRVSVVLLPDAGLSQKMEADEKTKIENFRKTLTAQELDHIKANTAELKELQETPDSPEALKCVPALQLSDISKTITKVPTDVSQEQGATLLTHDLFTNNILYMEAALDMRSVPAELLPLVPLFCRSLTQMGTAKESFVELTERLGRKTGGLSISPFSSPVRGQKEPVAKIMVRGKAMADKAGDMLEVARDILLTARLDDRARFTQMVNETKSGLESGIIGSGHSFAARRLNAQHGIAGWMSEQMGGLSYLEYIRTLVKRVESDWDAVHADLESIRKALLQRSGTIVNLTADAKTLSSTHAHVSAFLSSLPDGVRAAAAPWGGSMPRVNEALTVPTQVNYVGKGGNLYTDAGYKLHGSAYVIEKYLGNTWLWDRVRVVGGAYGGFCGFDPQSGGFNYLSYRDPNLTETLDVYDGSADFLRGLDLNQDELTKAVIGTMGDIDAYQLPDSKGYSALSRYLLNVSDEERQQRRDEILGTSAKDFKDFAEVIATLKGDAGRVVAVTSAEKAKAVADAKPGFWDVKKVV